MKKNLLVLCLLSFSLFLFSITILAQNNNPSSGKIPMMHKNPKVPWVHTPPASVQEGDIAYGWESISSNIISMPIPAGTPFTTLAAWTPPNFASTATRGGDGNYYVVDVGPPNTLWQLDTLTGAVTELGIINGIESGGSVNGMCYDPDNGMYYMAAGVYQVTNNLYSFDLGTMTATLVGSFPSPTGAMIDIAINSSGIGFGYDLIDDNAYTFDPVSGTTTLLGSLGYDANYGQGMDINQLDGTIYLSAFNNATFTGQLRTMDPNTGATTLLIDWGFVQVAPFAINNIYGPPVGPGPATNPNPPSGTIGVALNAQLSWTNPAGATSIEVFFGTDPAAMTSIYSGTPVTTVDPGALSSLTTYYWRVDETDATGTTTGFTWHFTTVQVLPPNVFIDDHFNNLINWTIVGPMGQTNWLLSNSNNAGGTPPELEFNWIPSFVGDSWMMCNNLIMNMAGHTLHLIFKQYVDWYAGPFDLLFGVTNDGGETWTTLWDLPSSGGNVGPEIIDTTFTAPSENMQFGFAFSGNSFNINWWYIDDVYLEGDCLSCIPPNPPSNLTAQEIFNSNPLVQLNWQDNSYDEWGFKVLRKDGLPNDPGQFEIIGDVPANTVQYIDSTIIIDSTYSYGVIAYNQYGNSDTSNFATITIEQLPVELTSFNAKFKNYEINLNWSTATETNNRGFEIQRRQNNVLINPKSQIRNPKWEKLGFVNGNGTSTESHSYSFRDNNISNGIYRYRLKQIDFDGSFSYSKNIEIKVNIPFKFSLEQNYPNPFNPTTKISWQSPVGSWQTLRVYDVLGKEVATLLNKYKPEGKYEVEFNASNLPSGIYFYRLSAQGNNGKNFTSVKKMILIK